MKIKQLNPPDYKLWTISFSSAEDEISIGGNLYYPRRHVNVGVTDSFIFNSNTTYNSDVVYIEFKDGTTEEHEGFLSEIDYKWADEEKLLTKNYRAIT